jgi:hypothetical protein
MSVTLPSSLNIAGLRYDVSVDPLALATEGHQHGSALVGTTNRRHQVILIATDQHAQQIADTVMHEVLHVLTQVSSLANEWSAEREEEVVARLAPLLAQTLGANPELCRLLMRAWNNSHPRSTR